MCTHLTNAFVQKKHPSYDALKESTIWSMSKFEVKIREK
jgi:tubulin--tyrosine ligase like protein 10